MTLIEMTKQLNAKTQDIESLKADLATAKQLIASIDSRLKDVVGFSIPVEKKSLKSAISDVLNNSNEPLTVAEIAELVLENGYLTQSKDNFKNMVQQALNGDEFNRVTKPKQRPSRYAIEF
jgi:DNA-directed RNA polymerase specialized sigma54-like protein